MISPYLRILGKWLHCGVYCMHMQVVFIPFWLAVLFTFGYVVAIDGSFLGMESSTHLHLAVLLYLLTITYATISARKR